MRYVLFAPIVLVGLGVIVIASWMGGYYHHMLITGYTRPSSTAHPYSDWAALQADLPDGQRVDVFALRNQSNGMIERPMLIVVDTGEILLEYDADGTAFEEADSPKKVWDVKIVKDGERIPIQWRISFGPNPESIWPPKELQD